MAPVKATATHDRPPTGRQSQIDGRLFATPGCAPADPAALNVILQMISLILLYFMGIGLAALRLQDDPDARAANLATS